MIEALEVHNLQVVFNKPLTKVEAVVAYVEGDFYDVLDDEPLRVEDVLDATPVED